MAEEEYQEQGLLESSKSWKEEKDEGGGFFSKLIQFIMQDEDGGFFWKLLHFIMDIIGFGKPTAEVSGFNVSSITLEKADIVVDLLVTNPNPISIPLIDIVYLIESDGRKLLSGTIPDAGTIHARGAETLKVPISLVYQDIKNRYNIQPGEVIPYLIKVELIVDVPVLGRLTLPLEQTGEIPIPYKPVVDVQKIAFDRLSFEETTASLHLKVGNKNKFDLGIKALEYTFSLANAPIAHATLRRSANIVQRGEGRLEIPIKFRPKDLGSAVWNIILGRKAGYSMAGKLEVDTPFGPMHLPFSKEGGKTTFQKRERARVLDESDPLDRVGARSFNESDPRYWIRNLFDFESLDHAYRDHAYA